ncbi:3'-5' exonuclease [Flavobacterium sufflavum]|uniref:3'-5' exonuclease n=1 Tax=Flavobacterium sufflavum TaxID=1921138 RepID=A0A437KMY2_9FLAO|nr:exonuclease domain-containing protein [Flavobacterium sufflavum]RVT72748.1 3'-5' exonuclease [Flavobacterium sufflavum]
MLDWLKHINKEYPDFWKDYLAKFAKKSNRYVILSTEATGDSLEKDVITYISAFAVVNDTILIKDSFETILLQYRFLHDNHLSNEYIIESRLLKLSEPEALKTFIEYLGNGILVGHQIESSVAMINATLERLECGKLRNEALDIDIMHRKLNEITDDKELSLDELTDYYKIKQTPADSATEKAYKIALLFLKLKFKLGLK